MANLYAFSFLLTVYVIALVAIPVVVVGLIRKIWGYEPDAYERAYGGKA